MGHVRHVGTPEAAAQLAAELMKPGRARPAVVVSTGYGREDAPWVDPVAVADGVGDCAQVYVLATGKVTWAFTNSMPPDAQVYGDAARVYSTDLAWVRDARQSRLHLCQSEQQGPRIVPRLVSEALKAAAETGVFSSRGELSEDPQDSGGSSQREQDLAGRLARCEAALERARDDVSRLKAEAQELRKKARSAEVRGQGTAREDVLFSCPSEQFRHEVYLAWAQMVPAGEKRERPLPDMWFIGPDFLESLDAVEGISRAKVTEVVVQVLTGVDAQLAGRDLHRLRAGGPGNSPIVEREPGVYCWRVALQVNAPSARRLHYWRDGNVVELSRVVLHDDMTP